MANTLGGVNLAAIADQTLDYLGREFFALSAFTRNFSQDIKEEGQSVTTRIPSGVSAQDLSSGYSPADVTTTAKTITLNKFKGPVFGFTDLEITKAKNEQWLHNHFVAPAIEGTVKAVMDDLLALVLNAAFSANSVITAANFDSDDLADLAGDLTTSKVPKSMRVAMLLPTYYASVQKDAMIQDGASYGDTSAVREHNAKLVHGFNLIEYTDIPTNSENLTGFVCHPSALIIAARTVAVPRNAPHVEVINRVEPVTGLPVQFRRWYDANAGKTIFSMGLLYGVATGNGAALKRILSA